MANRIMLNQTSYHGAGAIQQIINEAKAHGFQKAFVYTDPDLLQFQVTTKVTSLLDEADLSYEIYADIKANPASKNVQHGVEAFKKAGADYIDRNWWRLLHGIHRRPLASLSPILNAKTSAAWREPHLPKSPVFRLLRFPPLLVLPQKLQSTMLSRTSNVSAGLSVQIHTIYRSSQWSIRR